MPFLFPPASQPVTMLFTPTTTPTSPPLRVFITILATDDDLTEFLASIAHALDALLDALMADQVPAVLHFLGTDIPAIITTLNTQYNNTSTEDKEKLVGSLRHISDSVERVRALSKRWLQPPEQDAAPARRDTIDDVVDKRGYAYKCSAVSIGWDVVRVAGALDRFLEMEFRVPEFRPVDEGKRLEWLEDFEVSEPAGKALEDIYARIREVHSFMGSYPEQFLPEVVASSVSVER